VRALFVPNGVEESIKFDTCFLRVRQDLSHLLSPHEKFVHISEPRQVTFPLFDKGMSYQSVDICGIEIKQSFVIAYNLRRKLYGQGISTGVTIASQI
jgi:hypothetical protein